ncbi:MFS transporter [Pediococcus pentosaceus]|uniref:MFS transporter n=1 Tax=Pediococcus pentosaceus TaxID=1255 RepID=UPI00137434DD|nr:MFS transporter [Pediococcus pentosaceus]QHO67369.1 Alpha-ketoglutarate permease [Pediococcus pentosaceus]
MRIINKFGISRDLLIGFVGLTIFMLGATIETGWFSSYLVSEGFSIKDVSFMFTLYGMSVAIMSWITSFLINKYSIKHTMAVGVISLLITTGILILGLNKNNFLLIICAYTFRGISYPLFAYSFLVLITLRVRTSNLGKATACFWLSFNLGMTIIGPSLSAKLLNYISPIDLLCIGCVFCVLGASLVFTIKNVRTVDKNTTLLQELKKGLFIMVEDSRFFYGMIVKTINNIGQFGFIIMMPIYLVQHQFTLIQWSTIWSACYIINSFASLYFGNLGDKIGWQKVLIYFSGTLTGVSCLIIMLGAKFFPGNYILMLCSFTLFAFGVAAFGPLSALIPAMMPNDKSTAVSVLNLGSGLSNFVGPIIVTLIFQKFGGDIVLIVFSVLYFFSSILSKKLKLK